MLRPVAESREPPTRLQTPILKGMSLQETRCDSLITDPFHVVKLATAKLDSQQQRGGADPPSDPRDLYVGRLKLA